MKFTLAVIALAFSVSSLAQQDLSSSNRDSTQTGVLSGTTNTMRDEDQIALPKTAKAAKPPAQTPTEETMSGTSQAPNGKPGL